MKIAIPTNDGINISNHFYNTQSFKIFTIEKGTIINEELRTVKDAQ
jgi:predicted Fe-Mo cluster-binding NifX family protein